MSAQVRIRDARPDDVRLIFGWIVELAEYERAAAAAGLDPVATYATWDREPFADGDYAVVIHRRRAH